MFSQAHVPGALSGPHHSGGHGPPPVMLLHPHQQGSGPQHGPPPQQGHHQSYTYITQPQGKFRAPRDTRAVSDISFELICFFAPFSAGAGPPFTADSIPHFWKLTG